VPLPDEEAARERTWRVVRAAHAEQEEARPPRRRLWPVALVAAAIAAIAAALTPPGMAVLDSIRKAVGVEHAQPALFSLPAPGRLLVVSAEGGGVWVVHQDGSKRRLGSYTDATWSPHGHFVVATRRNELAAVEPGGTIRWTLARRGVADPRWAPSGYRIAYAARSGLRVVAGDGTGDRRFARTDGPFAWHPLALHVLTYVAGGSLVHQAVDDRRVLWRARLGPSVPEQLAWSADGRRLLVVSPHELRVLGDTGRLVRRIPLQRPTVALGAEFARAGHVFAVHLRREAPTALAEQDRRSEVRLIDADRRGRSRQVFAGTGIFGDLAWSPNGRWLLVDWRTANQWLFIRVGGRPRVKAVANISRQFGRGDGARPDLLVLDRWCCPS
jgi:Tol biopolymer transport system component